MSADGPAVPAGGPGDPPVGRPCVKLRPHLGPHRWFEVDEVSRGGAGGVPGGPILMTQWSCPGVRGVSAEFIDRQEVTVVRCYGGDDLGARCTRMLVFDGGPGIADTDMHGWTVLEHYAGGVGDRVWACSVHS